jgi:hypothetical protein
LKGRLTLTLVRVLASGGAAAWHDGSCRGSLLGEGWVNVMAARAWSQQQKSVEEVFFQNDAVSLCLLLHRRAKTMRVVDFRAGPSAAKRAFVLSLARREGMEKVYTLVERDEVSTWVKLGFNKEGNIPGFYKRSDAFLLGSSVRAPRESVPLQSETRISIREPASGGESESEAHNIAERTLVHGKKWVKDLVEKAMPSAKVAEISETDAKKYLSNALRSGRALTAFEPFGRDVERNYFVASARGGFELVASTESQACFGNAFLELLTSPRNETERLMTAAALKVLCDRLLEGGVVSCFALAPSDDVRMASAFLYNGFRRTGLLENHLALGSERKDAIVWSRKLANPADE